MAGIQINEKLMNLINEIIENNIKINYFNINEIEILEKELKNNYITTDSLTLISKYLKNKNNKDNNLYEILIGTKLAFPNSNVVKEEESEEKKKRREYLLRKQQVKQYNKMIHGCERLETSGDSIAESLKSAKFTLAISSNMIMSIFATFGIGYYAASKSNYNTNQCLVAGIIAATIMYLVEMTLYIVRATKLEKAGEVKPKDSDEMKISPDTPPAPVNSSK